jgi:hypothetical protein
MDKELEQQQQQQQHQKPHVQQMQVQATMRQLDETQRRTLDMLSELNSSIRDLRLAVNNSRDWTAPRGFPPQSMSAPNRTASIRSLLSNGAVSDTLTDAEALDEGLDRKTVRLDGLEVYAVVSAVTAGTLVAVFDSYHPGDLVDLVTSGRFLEALMSIVFLVTGSVGIVCGLHCIFVFSLITMYGRTALGMERDDALEVFFGGTGLQRYHGFKTFVGSLYALMCELIVVITSKISSNPAVHLVSLIVTARLMYYVYVDTQSIIEKAAVIFEAPKQSEEEDLLTDSEERTGLLTDNGADADQATGAEDDGGIAASNHSIVRGDARYSSRPSSRRMTLLKRGSVMNIPATDLMKRGGGGKGSMTSNNSGDDADSNDDGDDDDSYFIQRFHGQMDRRGTNESRDSLDTPVCKRTSGYRQSVSLRRRLDRKSSSMNVAATDLIDS